mmetsp:Transcript_32649/g.52087  ORF Transcript_32649/g.52087 Transcript_32649/m.52087 type:complete len:313 (-) Transcript_32649:414-1352(-)
MPPHGSFPTKFPFQIPPLAPSKVKPPFPTFLQVPSQTQPLFPATFPVPPRVPFQRKPHSPTPPPELFQIRLAFPIPLLALSHPPFPTCLQAPFWIKSRFPAAFLTRPPVLSLHVPSFPVPPRVFYWMKLRLPAISPRCLQGFFQIKLPVATLPLAPSETLVAFPTPQRALSQLPPPFLALPHADWFLLLARAPEHLVHPCHEIPLPSPRLFVARELAIPKPSRLVPVSLFPHCPELPAILKPSRPFLRQLVQTLCFSAGSLAKLFLGRKYLPHFPSAVVPILQLSPGHFYFASSPLVSPIFLFLFSLTMLLV